MALIECNECNNQVSEYAMSCPSCGIPINKVNKIEATQAKTISKPKLEKYLSIVSDVVSISLYLHLCYIVLDSASDRKYLYQRYGGSYLLLLVLPIVLNIISIITKKNTTLAFIFTLLASSITCFYIYYLTQYNFVFYIVGIIAFSITSLIFTYKYNK